MPQNKPLSLGRNQVESYQFFLVYPVQTQKKTSQDVSYYFIYDIFLFFFYKKKAGKKKKK